MTDELCVARCLDQSRMTDVPKRLLFFKSGFS